MKFSRYLMIGSILSAFLFAGSVSAQGAKARRRAAVAGTDHGRFIEKFAIGYMGLVDVPFPDAPIGVHTLGVRYWLQPKMGLDVGVGISMGRVTNTFQTGGTTTETDDPQPFAFVARGGLPLVLADSKHLSLQVVPELIIGFGTNSTDAGASEISDAGFLLQMGARAGAELHFGFIDLPQLSLQAGFGAYLTAFVQSRETDTAGATSDASTSGWTFGGTPGPNPWDFLSTSIAALYYFD